MPTWPSLTHKSKFSILHSFKNHNISSSPSSSSSSKPKLFITNTITSHFNSIKFSSMTMALTLLLQPNLSHFKSTLLPSLPRRTNLDNFAPTPDSKRRLSTVKCLSSRNPQNMSSSQSAWDVLSSTLSNTLKALKKPAIAALLVGLLLMYDPNSAFAASGGRMGGRSFSSSSSSSSSRSYSVPRTSESRSFYSTPYHAPSPFGGVYVGPAVGVGVGAGSSAFFILAGFMAFVLVSGFLSDRSEDSVLTAAGKTTVLKIQVCQT